MTQLTPEQVAKYADLLFRAQVLVAVWDCEIKPADEDYERMVKHFEAAVFALTPAE